jgi:DNA polymerase elongation subunit (family B)
MVSNRHYLPRLQGDEMSQIGLTVNQVGSKDVTKYVFVVGGCDKVRLRDEFLQNRGGYDQGIRQTVLGNRPDIVTGYNIMGFDFMYIYKRATEISGTSSTCWKWGGSNRIATNATPFTSSTSALPPGRQRPEVHPHARTHSHRPHESGPT